MRYVLKLIFFLLYVYVFTLSCKKDDSNIDTQCLKAKSLIDYYSRNDNTIIPFLDYNNENATEYFVFKKYNLVSSVHYEYITSDSCAKLRVNEILNKRYGNNLLNIKKSIDSFNMLKEYSLVVKNYDGILHDKGYVRCKPMDGTFKSKLLEKVKEKDSTFRINSFWIVIDKDGNIKDIERYIKHSDEIDSFVIKNLKNYKWTKPMIKIHKNDENEVYVEARTIFVLKNEKEFDKLLGSPKSPDFGAK
ncbi:MAG: hypothetical protein KGZ81_00665 [Flavobacteriales bacterium]|nr:hypothetical protein [Flavobacteriales bacterium]